MNRAYRLVRNHARNLWVVASELVSGRGSGGASFFSSPPPGRHSVSDIFETEDRKLPLSTLMMSLEPRFMFDAAAVATFDAAEKTLSSVEIPAAETLSSSEPGSDGILDALSRLTLPADKTPAVSSSGVVFIDPRVEDTNLLAAGIKPGIEIVYLDPKQDGLTQIGGYLDSHRGIDSIYIISHGSTGSILLGTTALDASTVTARTAEISRWSASLTEKADILIYGCDTGAGSGGEALIAALATATGADIAASTDATGAARLGGNWTLERNSGQIESASPLDEAAISAYDSLLAPPSISGVSGSTWYSKGDAATPVFNGGTLTDADGILTGATVQISTNFNISDLLGISGTLPGGITSSYNSFTGTLSLSGNATPADYQTALSLVRFNATSGLDSTRTITLTVTDGTTTSAPATRSMHVLAPAFALSETTNGYIITIRGSSSELNSINLVMGTVDTVNPLLSTPGGFQNSGMTPMLNVNAIGFNPIDGHIYASNNKDFQVVRINSDYSVSVMSPVYNYDAILNPNAPVAGVRLIAGDIDASGIYYLQGDSPAKVYRFDTNPLSVNYLKWLAPLASSAVPLIADVARNPIDGKFYGVGDNTVLYSLDTSTGARENLGVPSGLAGTNFWGQYFDDAGFLYVTKGGNTMYKIDITNIATPVTEISFSNPGSTWPDNGDGARIVTIDLDYGDAPDSYRTSLGNQGARHSLLDSKTYIGAAPDTETGGSTSGLGTTDNSTGINDEFGITFGALSSTATTYSVNLNATNTGSSATTLIGWIDFDQDGAFETNEAASASIASGTNNGSVTLNWSGISVVSGASSNYYARFRIATPTSSWGAVSTDGLGTGAATRDARSFGPLMDGEVEDYGFGPPPTIIPNDGNGAATGHTTVYEAGLTSPADIRETNSGTISITAVSGIESIDVGGQHLLYAQLAGLAGAPVTITTPKGVLTLTGYSGNSAAGLLSYSYTLTVRQDTPPAAVTENTDVFALGVTDLLAATASGTLTVQIIDDTPTANADTNSLREGSGLAPTLTTGNVFGAAGAHNVGAGDQDVADRIGADIPVSPVTAVGFGLTSGTVGVPLSGSYGLLTLNSNGTYSYSLDNTIPAVNSLETGDKLTEVFNYTITDLDGDASSTTLTITINGLSDGPPRIVPRDGNGTATGHTTVYEAGLTSPADSRETNTDTIAVTAIEGIASIDVGGTNITFLQLNSLALSPITISTAKGDLKLISYSGDSVSGFVTYTYTLAVRQHTPPASETENSDVFALGITDILGTNSTNTLTVQIIDDVPTANADTNSVTEGSGIISTVTFGNVFGATGAHNVAVGDRDVADRIGADSTVTPVTAVGFGAAAGTVGAPLSGNYGTLTLNADGTYSYSLDNTNPAVDSLNGGGQLTEVFNYTITDADGDTSSTTLTITIKGLTDAPPDIVPHDGNGAATGHTTVYEAGLTSVGDVSEINTDTIAITAPAGISSIDVGGTHLTLAQLGTLAATPVTVPSPKGDLRLTGYSGNSTAGTLTYTYTLIVRQDTPPASVTENSDVFALKVSDIYSREATNTLTVQIIDDVPVANADTNTVYQGPDSAPTITTGNVFGATGAHNVAVGDRDVEDRIGADTMPTLIPVTAVRFGVTSGTPGAPLSGNYGVLTLDDDGRYLYALDNANLSVSQLMNGQQLTEVFNYTITDADGDSSSADLTITIKGTRPPIHIPRTDPFVDRNPRPVVLSATDNFSTIDIGGMRTTIAQLLTGSDGLFGIGLGGPKVTLLQLSTLIGGADTIMTSKSTFTLSGYSSAAGFRNIILEGSDRYAELLARANSVTFSDYEIAYKQQAAHPLPDPPVPAEKPLPKPSVAGLPRSQFFLLPSPDGSVGKISVVSKTGETRLTRAYESTELSRPDDRQSAADILNESHVKHLFRSALAAQPEVPVIHTLYFEPDSSRLTKESDKLLVQLVTSIRRNPNVDISISGHSDKSQSREASFSSSLERANAVARLMREMGANPDRVDVLSYGRELPKVDTPVGVAEPRNIRVEIVVR